MIRAFITVLLVVLLQTAAMSSPAGPDDDWRIYLRIIDTTTNQYSEVCIGTQTGASDNYVTGEDEWTSGYHRPYIESQPGWGAYADVSTDLRAPLQPGEKKEWYINMRAELSQPDLSDLHISLTGWNPYGIYDLGPGISIKVYDCDYSPFSYPNYVPKQMVWNIDPSTNGSATDPSFTFTGGFGCLASPEGEGWLVIAEAVPEPQSMVALGMGIVLTASRLRRKKSWRNMFLQAGDGATSVESKRR